VEQGADADPPRLKTPWNLTTSSNLFTLSRFLNEGLASICQYVLSVLDKCDQFAQCIGDHVEEVLHKPIPSDMVTIAVKLVQTPNAWLFYRI
jgi:hypothetical protein